MAATGRAIRVCTAIVVTLLAGIASSVHADIANGNFNGAGGWGFANGAVYDAGTTHTPGGTGSGKFPGAAGAAKISQTFDCGGGDSCIANIWMKAAANNWKNVLKITLRHPAGASNTFIRKVPAGAWVKRQVYVAGCGTTELIIERSKGADDVWVDDIDSGCAIASPRGACCLETNVCEDAMPEEECPLAYNGDGSTCVFGQTVTAADRDTLQWNNPADVVFVRGDLAGIGSYSIFGTGSLPLTTWLDINADDPSAGEAVYYLVRGSGCGSWQTEIDAEPERDEWLP